MPPKERNPYRWLIAGIILVIILIGVIVLTRNR